MLSGAGDVSRVHIGTDRETGRSRGFAFVEFANEADAAKAITQFDGFEVDGRKLRVNAAEDRPRVGGGRPDGPRPDRAPRPFASAAPPADSWVGDRFAKPKGSRRGLRARKRSLNF